MEGEKNIDPLVTMQQELCDMWGINNQTKYVFYYDESNNCRKFWVDDSKQQFNTDHTADFVLAGLVRKEEFTMRGLAYNPGILPAEMIIRQRVKPMPSREELLKRNSFPSVNQNKYLNAVWRSGKK